MPKPLHFPYDTKSCNQGANYMHEVEAVGANKEGEYLDGHNCRVTDMSGNMSDAAKILGEEIKYPHTDNSCHSYYVNFNLGDWTCLAATKVKVLDEFRLVELWADRNAALSPFIRVDGKIVCASPDLPINVNYPIQIHQNDTILGGEIYYTNFHNPPMIMNVSDMMMNSNMIAFPDGTYSCTEKYFTEFSVNMYTTNLDIPNYRPMFIEITTANSCSIGDSDRLIVAGGGFMKVGQYCYAIRYVDNSGNRTNWSVLTPCIPLLKNTGAGGGRYPGIKNYGADPSTQSNYGIVLKFRVYNTLNYSYIEVKRVSYIDGQGLGFTPSSGLLNTTIPITAGEISVVTFIDHGDTESPITDEEDTSVMDTVDTCKTLRYFNKALWLMNIKYASKEVDTTGLFLGGTSPAFPVVQKMGLLGHDDPYNHVYYKSSMGGEKFGYAAVFFNHNYTNSFAVPIPNFENYQMPDRRDECSNESINYSYCTPPVVWSKNGNVRSCFEKFDHIDATAKTSDAYYNISKYGQKTVDGVVYNAGTYSPLTPKGDSDGDTSGHNFAINKRVTIWSGSMSNTWVNYSPQGFGLNYYSLGLALKGIDMSVIPGWATSFTIARTDAAGRVMMQGLGFYKLHEDDGGGPFGSSGWKDRDYVWYLSPDLATQNGLITSSQISSVTTDYKAEAIAPYGFFSEVYMGENTAAINSRDWVDMCVYPRIQWDSGQINHDGIPWIYVRFGTWRNENSSGPTSPTWCPNGIVSGGSNKFTILDFQQVTSANAPIDSSVSPGTPPMAGMEYFQMQLNSDIYCTPTSPLSVPDQYIYAKQFHEPMYLFNIVNDFMDVPNGNVSTYYDTGCFVKIKSCIGKFVLSSPNSFFEIIDERWEDCIGALSDGAGGTIASSVHYAYVYINDGSTERAWLDVTYIPQLQIDTISNDIASSGYYLNSDGTHVYGMYRHINFNNANRFFKIQFNVADTSGNIQYPADGSTVWVKYDNKMPVRIFGGDTFIGENIYCVVDKDKRHNTPSATDLFAVNFAFPYFKWHINENMLIAKKAQAGGASVQNIQTDNVVKVQNIRQMVCVFNCETRLQAPFYHEYPNGSTAQLRKYFPATNYIMRPIEWDPAGIDTSNFDDGTGEIMAQYKTDYPEEYNRWGFGGFRYKPVINIDYMHKQNNKLYVSRPKTGYEEKNHYCTRILKSNDREINVQDTTNLKTFLSQNYFDISDETGCIKFAWDSLSSGKANNLYAITDHGVVLLITQKDIVNEGLTGVEMTILKSGTGNIISNAYWISKEIGMENEMWRSKAEGDNALMFANLDGAYVLQDNTVKNIADIKYWPKIAKYMRFLDGSYDYYVSAAYDPLHYEYWLQIQDESVHSLSGDQGILFSYNFITEHWNGHYDYHFDKYVNINRKVYGVGPRYSSTIGNAISYELDKGNTINGEPIEFWIAMPFSPKKSSPYTTDKTIEAIDPKEFKRIKVASEPERPTKVEFFDNISQFESSTVQSEIYGTELKDYHNYENYIPRRLAAIDPERKRMQGRLLIAKVIYSGDEERFKVISIGAQYNTLK